MNVQFTPTFLDQLRDRVDLSQIIGRRVKLTRHGKMMRGKCPFHNEKTPSFYVYQDQGTYHCYGCGEHGDAVSFMMHFENYTFPEAVKILADSAGIPLPQAHDDTIKGIDTTPLYSCLETAATWFQQQLILEHGQQAQQYLQARQFKPEVIQRFRLGYAPPRNMLMSYMRAQGFDQKTLLDTGLIVNNEQRSECYDRFRDRLMFPICNKQGRVIGFGGRILGTGEPKYLNSPETELFHKGHELYGHHMVRQANLKSTPLIVCEGYTDVLALHQAGYEGAVASLGTALTESQIELLWRLHPSPNLCFDGDEAGQKAAIRAAERSLGILKSGYTLNFLSLPAGDDPSSLLEKGESSTLAKILSTECGLAEFLWQRATYHCDFKTPDQKAILQQQLLGYAQQIQDYTLKNFYIKFFKDKIFHQFRVKKTNKQSILPDTRLFLNRPCVDPQARQHAILLLTLVNHPELLHDVFETLVQLEVGQKSMLGLREGIVEYYNLHHTLDLSGLKHHLYDNGYQQSLDDISREAAIHAPFADVHVDDDTALSGWWSVWNLCQTQQNKPVDRQNSVDAFAQQMSIELWQKIQRQRQDELAIKKQPLFES